MNPHLFATFLKGLTKTSIILLATVVFASTILTHYTVNVALGIVNAYEKILKPPTEEAVIILPGRSTTPVTGVLDTGPYAGEIENGTADDIVLTPAKTSRGVVVVRGLSSTAMQRYGVKVVAGRKPDRDSLFQCTVGASLARYLGVGPGDTIVVTTPFTRSQYPLEVTGIHEAPQPIDGEILTNRLTARILRNIPAHAASMIILYKPAPQAIGQAASRGREVIVVSPRIKRLLQEKAPTTLTPGKALDYFLGKLGVSQALIAAASTAVIVYTVLAVNASSRTFILLNRDLIQALRASQVPQRTAKALLAASTLTTTLAAVTAATLAYILLQPHLVASILLYPPPEQPPLETTAALTLAYQAALTPSILGENP